MYKKILVINMLHIGDLLLATPVLCTLRANFPNAYIALLADAKIDGLVKYNPHIDELISVDKKGYHDKLLHYIKLIGEIRRRKFDLVINLHPNERASAIAAFSGAKKIIGYASPGFGIFYDQLINNKNFDRKLKNRPEIPHQACEHLDMIRKVLGLERIVDNGLEMKLDDAALARADRLWSSTYGRQAFKVIGFNTGASWPTKRWTAAGFAQVADELLKRGFGVAFFGGTMDKDNVSEIRQLMKCGDHPRVSEFTGRTDLLTLAALIRKCAVFLTNDSGPMHIAVAQQVPIVAIFGSSNEVGFAPYHAKAVVLTAAGIPCRPCGHHCCGHHSCMTGIEPETVLKNVIEMAGEVRREPRPAVFFDRDGVLNVDKGYTFKRADFQWIGGAREAIKLFNDNDYYVFVVTNQSGVARGYYTEKDIRELHRWINEELDSCGAHIDAFYYCPHHPEGSDDFYRQNCTCRKPEPGLIKKAFSQWDVDKGKSLLIGDKESDIQAARAAGIQGYFFDAGNLLNFIRDSKALLVKPQEGKNV